MTGIAIAIALLVSATGKMKAAEPVFKGAAQNLMNPPSAVALTSGNNAMACAKCGTEWFARPIAAAKAMEPKTQLVARHLCNGCDTTITVEGHGKAKRDVVMHKCNPCGVESRTCCSTKKS